MNPYDIGPLIRSIVTKTEGVSDILFSAGLVPKAMVDGVLQKVPLKDSRPLTPHQTEMLAFSLLADNPLSLGRFLQRGSAVFSITVKKAGHFRVHLYRQRGGISASMRVIPIEPPSRVSLGLPKSTTTFLELKAGLVIFAGAGAGGKTSTLAAILQEMNQHHAYHITSVETPIEHRYPKGKSVIQQIEVGTDVNDQATGLEAAMAQNCQIIAIDELQDANMTAAIAAADSDRLVLATLTAHDAIHALQRMCQALPEAGTYARSRLCAVLRGVVVQHLLPRKDNSGRIAAFEVLHDNPQVREAITANRFDKEAFKQIFKDYQHEGCIGLQSDVQRLYREGLISKDVSRRHFSANGDDPQGSRRSDDGLITTNRDMELDARSIALDQK